MREIGSKLPLWRHSFCASQSARCISRLDLSWELRTRIRTRRILKKFITQNSTTISHGVFILLKLYTCPWDNIFKQFQSFGSKHSSFNVWISKYFGFHYVVFYKYYTSRWLIHSEKRLRIFFHPDFSWTQFWGFHSSLKFNMNNMSAFLTISQIEFWFHCIFAILQLSWNL